MNMVFVYGSLKKGFHNHVVLDGSALVCNGELHAHKMYSLGSFPAIVPAGHYSTPIQGEVYEVTDEVLARLDRLEGHPTFYERQSRKVWCAELSSFLFCHVYVFRGNVAGRKKVTDGVWKNEDSL